MSSPSPTACISRWRRWTTELREKSDSSVKALLDGVEITERALLNALEKHGVKRIEPIGQKFDPNRHQAMYEAENASVPAGHIAQVIQAGYLIGDRVLRPALVAVSKGAPKAAADDDNSAEPTTMTGPACAKPSLCTSWL